MILVFIYIHIFPWLGFGGVVSVLLFFGLPLLLFFSISLFLLHDGWVLMSRSYFIISFLYLPFSLHDCVVFFTNSPLGVCVLVR